MRSIFPKSVLVFSELFAVSPINSDSKYVSSLSLTYCLIALSINCLHLFYLPDSILRIERDLGNTEENTPSNHAVKILYSSVVYLASLVSRLNCLLVVRRNRLDKYRNAIATIDNRIPIDSVDRRLYRIVCLAVTWLVLTLTVPINVVRLRMFYDVSKNYQTVLLFCDMYFQNLSSVFVEVQFIVLATSLYVRSKAINRLLNRLLETSDSRFLRRRYYRIIDNNNRLKTIVIENEQSLSIDSIRELFKIYKHLYEAFGSVQSAYRFPLLASCCCLWTMTLFDVYMELFGFIGGNSARPCLGTYIWCAQYIIRFVLMTEASQRVINQGVKTRYTVSALNNRFLDSNTKEELMLFSNYIANTKIEFTACDFFTLNTHLITSAIAAGTTYLVILVQFHSNKD